jgi:hypothetical protein
MLLLNDNDLLTLQEIKDANFEKLTREQDKKGIPYLRHVFDLHIKLFGETCSSCPSAISGYIQKLKNYNFKNLEKMENENLVNYKLKEGVIVPILGTSDVYTNHNLTDEIAFQLLKENPNRVEIFEKMPENINELLATEIEVKSDEVVSNEKIAKVKKVKSDEVVSNEN